MNIYEGIKEGKEKIAVVGLGYVGLPLAVEFGKKVKIIGFDLNKKRAICVKGHIEDRKGHIFYGTIITPKQQQMLDAYNTQYPNDPCQNFDALWNKIQQEVMDNASKVFATTWDIIKTILVFRKRPQNYDATQIWNPGKTHLSCSATNCALFSKFGIDISKEFDKQIHNITPANLFQSEYFTRFYVT